MAAEEPAQALEATTGTAVQAPLPVAQCQSSDGIGLQTAADSFVGPFSPQPLGFVAAVKNVREGTKEGNAAELSASALQEKSLAERRSLQKARKSTKGCLPKLDVLAGESFPDSHQSVRPKSQQGGTFCRKMAMIVSLIRLHGH